MIKAEDKAHHFYNFIIFPEGFLNCCLLYGLNLFFDLAECPIKDLADRNDHICFRLKPRCVFYSGVLKKLF